MSRALDFKLDLLNRRRDEQEEKIYFRSNRNVIANGFLIGSSFMLIILIGYIYNSYKKSEYRQEINILQKDSTKFDTLILKSNKYQRQFNEIKNFNDKLAISISGLSSGSALISEIKNLTPKDIYLNSLSSNDSDLELQGEVKSEIGLSIINAFILKLQSSPFLEKDNIYLESIEVKENNKLNSSNRMSNKSYEFKINAKLSTNYNEIDNIKLIELGSEGLASRINILKDAGFLKWQKLLKINI